MTSSDILALADLPPTEHRPLAAAEVTGRQEISPQVSADRAEAATEDPLAPRRMYWRLGPDEAACRAAASSPIAALIEMEQEIVSTRDRRSGPDQSQVLQQSLLSLRATDLRNQAAGQGLELYFKLVEVESGRDAVRKSIRLVETAMKNLSELQDRGLSIDVDEFDLQQQRLELIERQHELVLQSDQLNRQLKLLLNATSIQPPVWPDVKLSVVFQPQDADRAVAIGVESRADLTMLRMLAAIVDPQAIATARSALRQREGSLGNQSPTLLSMLQVLQSQRGEREIRIRQRQLAALLATHHKAVVSEIRGRVAEVDSRAGQIRLAKRKLDQRRGRLAELQERQQAGEATAFDVFHEQLEIIRVQGELMKHVVAWKIAQAKLKQAQGLLAEECGFGRGGAMHEPVVSVPCDGRVSDTRPAKSAPLARRRRSRLPARSKVVQARFISSSAIR